MPLHFKPEKAYIACNIYRHHLRPSNITGLDDKLLLSPPRYNSEHGSKLVLCLHQKAWFALRPRHVYPAISQAGSYAGWLCYLDTFLGWIDVYYK